MQSKPYAEFSDLLIYGLKLNTISVDTFSVDFFFVTDDRYTVDFSSVHSKNDLWFLRYNINRIFFFFLRNNHYKKNNNTECTCSQQWESVKK